MKELALVTVIIAGLSVWAGFVEVHMPKASHCAEVVGVSVCVGRDEGGW